MSWSNMRIAIGMMLVWISYLPMAITIPLMLTTRAVVWFEDALVDLSFKVAGFEKPEK